jgi:hypothetical protein
MSALRGWWAYLGVTLASALVAHLIFDAVDDGLVAIFSRPIHLVYLAVVALAFAGAARDLYARRGAERRRRIALMQSALRARGTPLVVSLTSQLVLAATTLRLEQANVDRSHVAIAAACALFALLVGALLLRRLESGPLRRARAVFAARRPRAFVGPAVETPLFAVARADRAYGLFRPNRPPPLFA